MADVKGVWAGLPSIAKGIIAVIGVGGAAFGLYRLYKWSQDLDNRQDSKGEVRETIKDLKTLEKEGITPSYPDSEYKKIADALFTAMDGCGTYALTIASQFKKAKNNADMMRIAAAYGTRNKSCWATGGGMNGTLAQHIVDELSDAELIAMNRGLKEKGITYTF